MPLDKFPALEKKLYDNFNKINFFPKELNLYELNANNHSEVISLLGEDLKNDIPIFIKCLSEIMDNKPNNSCYIASQQLGGKTKKLNHGASFFVHRKSTWKPWIYASWKKNDLQEKEVALEWIYKSWSKLKRFYPNIHLAQLHNHLNSHEEEITLAFGNRINELKTLKNIFDPQGILPPLWGNFLIIKKLKMSNFSRYLSKNWLDDPKSNILSGLVVAFAMIPEAIAFSGIAGVDPKVGLFGAFCLSITIAIVGGRRGMITSATGSTALLMTGLVAYGESQAPGLGVPYLIAAGILTGIFQILWGYLRLAYQMRFVPTGVLSGFVNALALLIFQAQLPQLGIGIKESKDYLNKL